jgi:hypothetical protein
MFDELWSEIQDSPGEIFDIQEDNEEELSYDDLTDGLNFNSSYDF